MRQLAAISAFAGKYFAVFVIVAALIAFFLFQIPSFPLVAISPSCSGL